MNDRKVNAMTTLHQLPNQSVSHYVILEEESKIAGVFIFKANNAKMLSQPFLTESLHAALNQMEHIPDSAVKVVAFSWKDQTLLGEESKF